MKRKVLAVMLSAVMAIGLGACGNSGKDTSEKTKDTSTGNGEEITLRYAGWGSNSEKKATQKVIDKFEEEHPNIKVEYLHIPTDYNTKLTTMMAAGQEPDVAMVTGDTALQIIETRQDTKSIGFNNPIGHAKDENVGDLLRQVMPQDLTKFGLIPEFVGRVPIVVTLNSLDETALMKILVEPKNSLVKQYKKLFELDGVQLDFKEDALEAIAKKSLERKTGARGLRAIMEDTMMDLMYEIPSDNTTKECVITKDAVEKKAEPEIIHGEPAPVPRRNMGRRSGRPETA